MKNVLFLVLLFVANVTFSQDVFTNKSIGFTIQQPPTWIKAIEGQDLENLKSNTKLDKNALNKLLEESKGTIQVVSFYKYPIDATFGMIPTIKVNFKSNPHKNFPDFRKSIEESFSGIKTLFPDFKYTSKPTEGVIDGKKCFIASFMYTVKSKEGNTKVKTIQYAIPVKDKFYQITLIDTENDNINIELFEKIITTIKIR